MANIEQDRIKLRLLEAQSSALRTEIQIASMPDRKAQLEAEIAKLPETEAQLVQARRLFWVPRTTWWSSVLRVYQA
ncbi:MAG: hypothetical protein R6X34_12190 [Chloroflexota bacterium]